MRTSTKAGAASAGRLLRHPAEITGDPAITGGSSVTGDRVWHPRARRRPGEDLRRSSPVDPAPRDPAAARRLPGPGSRSPATRPGLPHRPPPAGAGSVVNRCGGGCSAVADAPSAPAQPRPPRAPPVESTTIQSRQSSLDTAIATVSVAWTSWGQCREAHVRTAGAGRAANPPCGPSFSGRGS